MVAGKGSAVLGVCLVVCWLGLAAGQARVIRVCVPYPVSTVGFLRDCTAKIGLANTEEVEFKCVDGGSPDKVRGRIWSIL